MFTPVFKLSIFLITFSISACMVSRDAVFYSSTATVKQTIPIVGNETIMIRCYCPQYTVRRVPDLNSVSLVVKGTYSVEGFHGSRKNAGTEPITSSDLEFRSNKKDNIIILDSPEWTYIHHALLIDELEVMVPCDLKVQVDQLSFDDLEGRNSQ